MPQLACRLFAALGAGAVVAGSLARAAGTGSGSSSARWSGLFRTFVVELSEQQRVPDKIPAFRPAVSEKRLDQLLIANIRSEDLSQSAIDLLLATDSWRRAALPEAPRGDRRSLNHRPQLLEGDVGIELAVAGKGTEPAIAAGDHAFAPDDIGKAADALGDELAALDIIGRGLEHAWDQDLVIRLHRGRDGFDISLMRGVIAVVLEHRHEAGRGGCHEAFDGTDPGQCVAQIGEILSERLLVLDRDRPDADRPPRRIPAGHSFVGG